ncbi:hypothetical protein PILCRDRAFT_456469 [Piloderma croceum F 1598]|uniref:Secreted protein n=1 Tax=Piloderma croceum (strain F 1598) TaxID=765440 RepID=A0A0C3FW64_PILCF|nr:hypothetical protein PILCRDRAFT_456469 [Piloderma croceum F 1598]
MHTTRWGYWHPLPQVCLCIDCILPLFVGFRQVHGYTVVIHVLCCCKNSMRWRPRQAEDNAEEREYLIVIPRT